MSFSFVRNTTKQIVMVLSITLIVVAAYVSIGRQFMPAVSRYKSLVEEQIAEAAGVEVTIDSLTGYFEGFNPVISLQGLQFQVLQADIAGPGRERALKFARATIILNMIQTIWQRQIVLENFVIEGLEIGATQREDGSWQISGMNLDSPTGTFDPNIVYKTIQRVSRLELTDLNVELQSLAGNSTRLLNSTAVIQNSSGNHFIHINTTVDGSDHEILVSAEVTGDTLDEVKGLLHINLPQADYSPSSINEVLGEITLGEMVGGGHAWIDLDKGQVQSIFLQGDIDSLNFRFDKSDMLTFEKLRGSARLLLDAGEGNWDFSIQNLQFNWNERSWSESGAHVQLDDDGIVRFKADSIDLDILREIVVASGLVGTGVAREINAFRPRGKLRNLSVAFPLQDDVESNIELSANIENVGVDSAHGSPDMTGINGYLELSHDVGKGVTQGVAEVESENFTIRIPNVFLDSWNYDYVNGRLNFRIESQGRRVVKLSSSMITAESDIVDGRAQFSSTAVSRDGKRVSQDLSLLVGVLRVDGNLKSPYLPTGPKIPQGLRSTMQWLDQALLDASVFDSGIIFHGSVMPGSLPLEKTFQAFFDFDDGQLNYVDEWPELYGVSGKAIVDNQDIDIRVENGRSLELDIGPTTGKVRRDLNGKQWLTVQGISTGTTQAGMDFLKVAPLGNAFADTFDSWQVQGNVIAELDLRIPFNQPAAEPWVNVSATLDSNSLFLPEYQLQFDNVTGVINFDTDTGLHDSVLQTRLFDNSASVSVTSTQDGPQGFVTDVQVDGVVDGNVLARWPGQSAFVRDLLLRTSGEMNYTAQLTVQQSPAQQTTTRLRINSDLQGLALLLPQPFQKEQSQPMPLNLTVDFDNQGTRIEGTLGSQLTIQVALEDEAISNGIVYLGTLPGVADPWISKTASPGLELRGNLDILNVSEWLDMLNSTQSVGSPARDLTSWVSLVNLDVGILDVFGQQLQTVNVEIQDLDNTDYWTIGLISDAITGSVLVPFDNEEYIEAYLAFLRLPGGDSDEPDQSELEPDDGVAEEEERIDVLAQIDPRSFPRIKFFTGKLIIGEKDFGLGQFTLDPGPDGAEFSNLIANFRGLQIGTAETEIEPHFSWHYNGIDHHSYLTGMVLADDLAEVLEANGYAGLLQSDKARFDVALDWPGSPAFFAAKDLSGSLLLKVEDGRFLQGSGGPGALKLISIINLSAIMRRARLSDDLLRSGLAYEEITGDLTLEDGRVSINDRLIISGPSSVYQIGGVVDLENETIDGEMYLTLPLSDNIPWIGLLTANIPLAIGAYLFDRIFGDRVDSLTSAQYTLKGPWEGLEPEFKQAFGTPPESNGSSAVPPQN